MASALPEVASSSGAGGDAEAREREAAVLAKRDAAAYEAALASEDEYYDEVEIEDMELDEAEMVFKYPCPCGDEFRISIDDVYAGEVVATCPSCSLLLKVIYDPEDFVDDDDDEDEDEAA